VLGTGYRPALHQLRRKMLVNFFFNDCIRPGFGSPPDGDVAFF
jgi:hypothetical protein